MTTKCVLTCDRCGATMKEELGAWTVAVVESHGVHRGTMGIEDEVRGDLCVPCGQIVIQAVRDMLQGGAAATP